MVETAARAHEPTRPGARRRVSKFLVPDVIFGIGMRPEVGGAVRRIGGVRPMLVSDAGVVAAGWVERALPHLAEVRVEWRLWHHFARNPKDREVEAAFESYLESGCDALPAVGGGSCIDIAKAVAVVSGNGGRILDYEGIDRATSRIPPMVMVPTSGSGGDVSQFCVTDTSRGLKATIGGRALVPDISLTDPGLDALSHAIGSCVSEACDFLSRGHALAAVRAIVEHLPVAVEHASDLRATEGMVGASLKAGLVFTNALPRATHTISHQIDGALDLPHGLLNAILMPHVMGFNAETCAERYVDVASALGRSRRPEGTGCGGRGRRARGGACPRARRPGRVARVGLDPADFDSLARTALRDAYPEGAPSRAGARRARRPRLPARGCGHRRACAGAGGTPPVPATGARAARSPRASPRRRDEARAGSGG